MVLRDVSYVPQLYKIFDEILVNIADDKICDQKMTIIKIEINMESEIIFFNNGRGRTFLIPHQDINGAETIVFTTRIFGNILSSLNCINNNATTKLNFARYTSGGFIKSSKNFYLHRPRNTTLDFDFQHNGQIANCHCFKNHWRAYWSTIDQCHRRQ
ncbi:dna topoisomerase 2-alpha-like protein [Dermatophagoides farinae]|uniref:DNA topoisomerase (ATP-hydrolyzing) n=1 Tax=Dermatophagoides farinae TaxID=6954 RepID=A0A9D4NS14_DERFA|nr:dna topoisomerase 2-alpha-like protein [Dermatophagoides farinae]